jgi:hypothetical protein
LMPAYELSDSSREEIASAAKAQMRKHSGGTAESEAAFKKFSAIYLEMLADPVPTAQDMYNEVMRRYDALPTQWGYALIYCWRQVASEWGLAGFQSPKEVSYAESYERLHLTKPLEFEGD